MSKAALPAGMGLAVNRSYAWQSLGNHLVGNRIKLFINIQKSQQI